MIRNLVDPNLKYDHQKHKADYDKLADFAVEHVQSEMKEKYDLQEVWIPEKEQIEAKYHQMPKCNIFMSTEFHKPKPKENKGSRALVLIQGTGLVRAGIWARSVTINENLE